jgi:hypothetical protein
MALFSDKELLKGMEDATKEKLRKNGLSRVRVTVISTVSRPQIKLDADNEEDMEKAKKLLAS